MESSISWGKKNNQLIFLALVAGLLQLLLLPIGLMGNISGLPFKLFFFAHILVLSLCVVQAIAGFLKCVQRSELSIVVIFAISLLLVGFAIFEIAHPIVARDALIHHLAVPKWWIERDRIFEIPWHDWSYYPMLLNLGYTGLLYFGYESLTAIYHGCYLLIMAGLVCTFVAEEYEDSELGLISFLIVLSIPICLRLATMPLVDLGLGLYIGIGLIALIKWAKSRAMSIFLLLAGVSLGLALGCKYNALLAILVILGTLPILCVKFEIGARKAVIGAALSGAVALAIFSPWLVKNFSWTENPLYPLGKALFGPDQPPGFGSRSLGAIPQRMALYGESLFEILSMPLRMILLGQDDDPKHYDGVLTPILLLAFLPILARTKKPWVNWLSAFCAVYFVFAVLEQSARIRYLSPLLVPLVILTVEAMALFASKIRSVNRLNSYMSVFGVSIVWTTLYIFTVFFRTGAINYSLGNGNKDQYLRSSIPEFRTIEFINSTLPPDSKIYLLYTGNQFYYYNRDVISGGYFSGKLIGRWLFRSNDSSELTAQFKEAGVTHIFAHSFRTKEGFDSILPDEKKALWTAFTKEHLNLIQTDGPFGLWEIK